MDLSALHTDLQKNGFDIEPDFSGLIKRFNREGKLNGWAIGEEIEGQAVFSYGDWKTGEHFEWASTSEQDFTAKWTEHREAQNKLKSALQKAAAEEAEDLWDTLKPYGSHTYLDSKKLHGSLFGARLANDSIYIPIRDIEGKISSLQKIMAGGAKRFHEGGRLRGCFHTIGETNARDRLFICEGYSTGASIYLAFEKRWIVVCAMNAGNLWDVALEIRRKYEDSEIIICADNDSGTKGNPGLTKAKKIAAEIGARVVYPTFENYEGNPTDFNDLHCRQGLDAVRHQIERGLESSANAAIPIAVRDQEGKKKKPSELQIVKSLCDYFEDSLVQATKELFKYDGVKWCRLGINEENAIKQRIQQLAGGLYDLHHINATYAHFLTYIQDVGDKLYSPKPFLANFQNGTLHLEMDKNFNPSFSFIPHNRNSFVTNVLPLHYSDTLATNDEFMRMMERVFKEDKDAEEKIRATAQMYGACVLPAFPHFFLFHGPKGTGKSTLMLVASHLVAAENLCGVEPHEFTGFLMESMIGKLVNLVTDIKVNVAIDDANIKKIEDRRNFRIDRKHKESINAPLPSVHIFGANSLPKTFDGSSGAHERRWTFLEVQKFKATGFYNRDYALEVFNGGPEGVLKFAMEGLKDTLKCRGHYLNPSSGVDTMREWQLEYDMVGQYLDEMGEGEVVDLIFDAGGRVEKTKVWTSFSYWLDAQKSRVRPGKIELFRRLTKSGITECKIDGVRYFRGFSVRAPR